ncbi:MAG: hypothetical protein WCW29_04425 [Candidatus Paceibacterota bacterium]|jgi:hypothetical protein
MSYLSYLKQPKKKRELNAFLRIYGVYKKVIYHYLNEPNSPLNEELNIFYIRKLVPAIQKLAKDLKLDSMIAKKNINLSSNYILFSSLFVSEKILQNMRKDSDYAKVEVSNIYGQIKELVEFVKAVMQEPIPEIEEIIDEGRELINASEFTKTKTEQEKEGVRIKGKKRIWLPQFPRTEWAKVSIKFTEERSIILSDSRDNKPCEPQNFGLIDERTGKPDATWKFLIKVAKGNGVTDPIKKDERELQKKQKQALTDILRTIFKNNTPPFETRKGGIYVANFNIKYFEEEENRTIPKEKVKYLDLEKVRSEMTESTQENVEYDIKHNLNPDKDGEYSQ